MKKLFILALASALLFTTLANAAGDKPAKAKADPVVTLKAEVASATIIASSATTLESGIDRLIAALTKAKEDLNLKTKEATDLTSKLAAKTNDHATLEKQNEDLLAQIALLKNQLDAIKGTLAAASGKVTAALASAART